MDDATTNATDMYGFDPSAANLNELDPVQIICYLSQSSPAEPDYLGVRISAVFVILVTSTACTMFPVLAVRVPKLHIPYYLYLFIRYFGAGVIVATAFIHLLDPAYDEIGPSTCVGMTGGWAEYSWCPAIVFVSTMFTFLLDFAAERYVQKRYGISAHSAGIGSFTEGNDSSKAAQGEDTHSSNKNQTSSAADGLEQGKGFESEEDTASADSEKMLHVGFQQDIAGFFILEFGVIFHSVIIGLTLATAAWDDFRILYVVIVFHQAFEGLGVGARLSAIQMPSKYGRWLPWALCLGYGISTPIAIAAGLGVRDTYDAGSFTASVVSGVLDALSAGILLFTGIVELLARDFLFDPRRTTNDRQLLFMVVSVLLGAGIMALLGKWA